MLCLTADVLWGLEQPTSHDAKDSLAAIAIKLIYVAVTFVTRFSRFLLFLWQNIWPWTCALRGFSLHTVLVMFSPLIWLWLSRIEDLKAGFCCKSMKRVWSAVCSNFRKWKLCQSHSFAMIEQKQSFSLNEGGQSMCWERVSLTFECQLFSAEPERLSELSSW